MESASSSFTIDDMCIAVKRVQREWKEICELRQASSSSTFDAEGLATEVLIQKTNEPLFQAMGDQKRTMEKKQFPTPPTTPYSEEERISAEMVCNIVLFPTTLLTALQNSILEEALNCKTCDTYVDEYDMQKDINDGVVNLGMDPAFTLPRKDDELISPFSNEPPVPAPEPGYLAGATPAQLAEFKRQAGSTALEAYELHRHIHQHRIARRGFFSICQDPWDLDDYRSFCFHMAEVDSHPDDSPMDYECDWPRNNHQMEEQEDIWLHRTGEIQKRVERRRAQWEIIKERRHNERNQLLKKMKPQLKEVAKKRREKKRAIRKRQIAEAEAQLEELKRQRAAFIIRGVRVENMPCDREWDWRTELCSFSS